MLCEHVRSLVTFPLRFQIEKSQGEIYRLRAKLESTQSENENMADELEKMQRALNQSYSDRDRIGSDLDKLRDDLERSQVMNYAFFCIQIKAIYLKNYLTSQMASKICKLLPYLTAKKVGQNLTNCFAIWLCQLRLKRNGL